MAKGKYQEWLTEEGLIRLEGWARDGLSDEQIAKDKIGINPCTLYDWKNKYPKISNALRAGKDVPDRKVENALYNSCFDRKITVRRPFKVKEVYFQDGKRCEKEKVIYGEEEVAVPANERAQEFWLANRKPEQWSNKEKLEVSGNIDFADVVSKARERAKYAAQNNGNP